jgi:pyridoxal phosphate enzyme (YggS family)
VADLGRLKQNLAQVRERIAEAAVKAGRDADSVKLISVTKTVPVEIINELYKLGERDFGENRAQVGVPKVKYVAAEDICWHFIGHLQRNKVRDVFPAFSFLHSLDSSRLAKEIETQAEAKSYSLPVTLEVKTSEEDSKLGVSTADEVYSLIEEVIAFKKIKLTGLMTMAPFFSDQDETRPYFASLRELAENIKTKFGIELPHLSMGMSNDYTQAVAEGATMVRVGSALYEGV